MSSNTSKIVESGRCWRPMLLLFNVLLTGSLMLLSPYWFVISLGEFQVVSKNAATVNVSQTFVNLLDPVTEEWWQYGSISTASLPELPIINANCSCLSGNTNATCCWRFMARSHKMGYMWSVEFGRPLKSFLKQHGETPFTIQNQALLAQSSSSLSSWPQADMRSTVLLRDIYAALSSGYLYHMSGRECWLDSSGKPTSKIYPIMRWNGHIQTVLDQEYQQYASLCHLLANETTDIGLRFYIEWTMTYYYQNHGIFAHLALAQLVPWIQERTKIVCFEKVTAAPVHETMQELIDFYYPSFTSQWAIPSDSEDPQAHEYTGGHSTSHDLDLRNELHRVILELDVKYFGGQIAWLDSVIPCGKS